MTRSLNLTSVAEGVETRGQENFLKSAGCHQYQGFFLSKPVPAEQLVQFVKEINKPIGARAVVF